jgi:hypothetical protein
MANPEARMALMKQFANPEVLGPMLRAMGAEPDKETAAAMVEALETAGAAVAKAHKAKRKGKKP